jgi:hypothetical protein
MKSSSAAEKGGRAIPADAAGLELFLVADLRQQEVDAGQVLTVHRREIATQLPQVLGDGELFTADSLSTVEGVTVLRPERCVIRRMRLVCLCHR